MLICSLGPLFFQRKETDTLYYICDTDFVLQKEQSDGDYQNLVFCIMHERDVGLQEAINILTEMLNQRVDDYIKLKSELPSFGADVDAELEKYLHALENFVQGTVLWYYLSPSECRGSTSLIRQILTWTL